LLKEKKYVTFANIIPWLSLHSVGALMMPNRFGGTAAADAVQKKTRNRRQRTTSESLPRKGSTNIPHSTVIATAYKYNDSSPRTAIHGLILTGSLSL